MSVRHGGRLLILGPLLSVAVLGVAYSAYAFSRPVPQLTATTTFEFSKPAEQVALSWPAFGEAAVGAIGYGVLDSNGGDKPLPTASTIKVLTALAVLRQKPLAFNEGGPLITLSQADVDSYNKYLAQGGSVVQVAVGEQISEYQALQALLLPSANNMAETLARWAFGSIDAYCIYAGNLAQSLGMASTTVTDPSGFLSTTTSTPHDLTLLAQAAIDNQVIAQIVRQPSATIPVQGKIRNVNALLGQDGIVGLKTGNNDQDAGAFLFAAEQRVAGQSITFIGAIMDGPTLGDAMWGALPLIKSMDTGFTPVMIAQQGTVLGTYDVPWQGTVRAVAARDTMVLAWRGQPVTTTLTLNTLRTSAAKGQYAGNLNVYNGAPDGTIVHQATIPVTLATQIDGPPVLWRLFHSGTQLPLWAP